MKKKIPFSLEYKDKIENGEVEVVTRDDRPVSILKWDAKSKKYPIIGTIVAEEGEEDPACWQENGAYNAFTTVSYKDLFLLVEEELTEFQALLQEFANMLFENYTDEDHIIISSTLESWEKKFLEYAEDALEKKFRTQSFQQGYEQALEDTQKALLDSVPKWKHQESNSTSGIPGHMFLTKDKDGNYDIHHCVMGNRDYIDLEELEKLPKE